MAARGGHAVAGPSLRIGRREGATRLPVLLGLPLAGGELVLATRGTWPVDKDLFCVELPAWPDDAVEVERVPVHSCRRVGASVQLVLDRAQRRRSMFVWTRKGARTLVFWRSERSMRSTRPGVRAPTARGLDGPLSIVVDERERYAWRFTDRRVSIERRRLGVGDYAVFEGERLVAVVERKKLSEFAGAAVQGGLQLQLAELATMPRAVVVIEGRLSQLLKDDLRTRPGWLLNLVAALQASYPNVPLLFAETGPLAADLAYRWLSASLRLARAHGRGVTTAEALSDALGPAYGDEPLATDGTVGSAAATTAPLAAPRDAPLFAGRVEVAVARADAPLDRAGRQRALLERLEAAPEETVTVKQHAERSGVSAPTAALDLRDLEQRGDLIARGARRSLRFRLRRRGDGEDPQ